MAKSKENCRKFCTEETSVIFFLLYFTFLLGTKNLKNSFRDTTQEYYNHRALSPSENHYDP